MSTIIRASNHNHTSQTVAFNFDDMAARAQGYLDKVRAEAKQIVQKAAQEAQTIRQNAEKEGKAAGQQAVEQMVAKQLTNVLPALRNAVGEIEHAKQGWLKHWEGSAVHVATAIAQRLIRRELQQDPQIPVALVREALQLAAGNARIRIHLNTEDHRAIAQQVESLVQELSTMTEAEIVASDSVSRGGCRVETEFGVIDQQFEAQLKRIEEELT